MLQKCRQRASFLCENMIYQSKSGQTAFNVTEHWKYSKTHSHISAAINTYEMTQEAVMINLF